MKILLLNGPNLNLLGEREPEVYGTVTLNELEALVMAHGARSGAMVMCKQSNHEGELIDWIHAARHEFDGIVINPGALTHYSYALRDAVSGISIPVVEVHLSDIESREEFRRISVIAPVCLAQISGHGINSYKLGIDRITEEKAGAQ